MPYCSATELIGRLRKSSLLTYNVGLLKPSIRRDRDIWVWINIPCAASYAIQKHWCLVTLAYSLLNLACLPSSLISGRGKIPSHPIKTLGEVCRKQGQRLIEELILLAHDRLLQGKSADEVFSRLFAKQRKEVPA